MFGLHSHEDAPANEPAYGCAWTDDFDLELIKGVKDGYFDPEKIKKHAHDLQDKIITTKADGSFEDAWRLYHDSFENNEDELLDKLHASFVKNVKYITPTNLSGTVSLFKELGRTDQAREMLKYYIDTRNEDRAFFDLDANPFSDSITDPDVRAAFKERSAQVEERRDIAALLLSRGEDGTTTPSRCFQPRQLRSIGSRSRSHPERISGGCSPALSNLIASAMRQIQ